MTHPAPNSELTAESVKLLKAGDVVRRGAIVRVVQDVVGHYSIRLRGEDRFWDYRAPIQIITFIGRPDADGWIPHDGGPNPVPGRSVDYQTRHGYDGSVYLSEHLVWPDIIAFRLAAPSVERTEGHGSSADADTHRAAEDQWAVLEGLAKAATPGPWTYRDMRPSTYGPAFVDAADVQSLAICGEAVGRSDTHGFCLQVDSEVRMSNAAFIAAANPATVLKLIEAARAAQVGMSEANEPSKDEIIQRQGEDIERLRGALEPFAAAADELHEKHRDGLTIWESPAAMVLEGGHLRKARDVQARARQGGPDHG